MKGISIAILILSTWVVRTQKPDTLLLWNSGSIDKIDIEYAPSKIGEINPVQRISLVNTPSLVVYRPKIPNESRAGIIISPGGGYKHLAIDKEGSEIAEWLNGLGYTTFVLQYSIPGKREEAFKDIDRAIQLVRSKAWEYNLNSNKIGIMGFSAGGHLSARIASSYNSVYNLKADKIKAYSSRPNFVMLIYPAYLDNGINDNLSPEIKVKSRMAPFFIFGTADDVHGNSSLVMASSLRNKNVPVELHMMAHGGHGYGLRKGNLAAETWPVLAEKWLKKTVESTYIYKYERTLNFPKITEHVVKRPDKRKTWVFIMAGQSNMAGRGMVEPKDTIASKRILTIDEKGNLINAKEPLSFYEPSMAGLDCGLSFGKELLKNVPKDVNILIVPTAVGGSSIRKWLNDSIHRNVQLFSNFKEKVAIGRFYGTIKGVLWHQGESDANTKNIPHYKHRLSQLVSKFRATARNKKLPILIGELGAYSNNNTNWAKINDQIKTYVMSDDNALLIDTSDLHHRGDKVHFDSESQRLMGKRFAEAYRDKYH